MDIIQPASLLWGHTLHEYSQMFDLETRLFKKRILELGFGPSSLNAELSRQGCSIISCHDIYQYSHEKILSLAKIGFADLFVELKQQEQNLVWKNYHDLSDLIHIRELAYELWQQDLAMGLKAQRYQQALLPHLPFADHEFGLILCPNTQFGKQTTDNLQDHLNAIKELCRVADEVRIFPLLNRDNQISPLLPPLIANLHIQGYGVEVRQVDYELHKGGNAMLRVWTTQCVLPTAQKKVKSVHVE